MSVEEKFGSDLLLLDPANEAFVLKVDIMNIMNIVNIVSRTNSASVLMIVVKIFFIFFVLICLCLLLHSARVAFVLKSRPKLSGTFAHQKKSVRHQKSKLKSGTTSCKNNKSPTAFYAAQITTKTCEYLLEIYKTTQHTNGECHRWELGLQFLL